MNKRQMLRMAGGGAIMASTVPLLPGCSREMPADAVAAWQGPTVSLRTICSLGGWICRRPM
jgi:hypothetical protein